MVRITLDKISKEYSSGDKFRMVLDDVSVSIYQGEYISLRGPSGSGKSSFLNIIGLLTSPTSGKLFFDDMDVSSTQESDKEKIRLNKIGFIFQRFHLIPTLTVIENVMLPMREAGLPKSERILAAGKILDNLEMIDKKDRLPGSLSGGEQQRVAVARALANHPEIILADEPTGELDENTSEDIISILEEINRDGKTLVIVSHDESVYSRAGRIFSIKNGKINEE